MFFDAEETFDLGLSTVSKIAMFFLALRSRRWRDSMQAGPAQSSQKRLNSGGRLVTIKATFFNH